MTVFQIVLPTPKGYKKQGVNQSGNSRKQLFLTRLFYPLLHRRISFLLNQLHTVEQCTIETRAMTSVQCSPHLRRGATLPSPIPWAASLPLPSPSLLQGRAHLQMSHIPAAAKLAPLLHYQLLRRRGS